jgi:hypothetical protein
MSFSTSIVQPVTKPVNEKPASNNFGTSLLGLLMLSVYAAHKSRKAMRKMKRQLVWQGFKLKVKSMFSNGVSDRTLIYILVGVVLLALLFIEPVLVLVLALVLLILILAHVIEL